MKRKIKNIILVVILILSFISVFLTMNYAKNHIKSNNQPMMGENDKMDKGNAPEKPDGDNSNIPEKPEVDNANIPEKPSGDNDSNVPEMGEGNKLDMPNDSNRPDMPFENESSAKLETIYYVLFGIESLIIVSLIIYLIMSNCNKKTIKETFTNKDKIIIYVLLTLILTTGMTYLDKYVTESYLLKNNTSSSDKKEHNNNSNVVYSGKEEITSSKDIDNKEYTSSAIDENAILISGEVDVNISNSTITKTGDSSEGDNTSFYGINSALIAKDKANVTIKNITVETEANGANGVFCYGGSATTNNANSDGTTITISDSVITTKKDNSGGIMTTGGGIMNANNLTITTYGTSSASIRTDRGGGKVTVNGGTYETYGQGSPTIYSTADITVSNATLKANASEGIVIEGKNSVTLLNSTLIDTNNKLNGKSTTYKNIFLYQSMSGDASTGTSTFTAKNSNITTNKGDTFYVTNTSAVINLENNTIVNNDTSSYFLRIQKDSWGSEGKNGGDVTLNATNESIKGNIAVDDISSLKISLTSSSYEGSINNLNTKANISLVLDKNSTIKLTSDTYITSLENADTANSNINFNGYKLYVNGVAIN